MVEEMAGRARRAAAPLPPDRPNEITRQISDRDFSRFQKLILHEAGIYLAPVKKALLVGRVASHMRQLGLTKFSEYYDVVIGNEFELVEMFDRICTNETHFFRDPRQFEFLQKHVVPELLRAAACGARDRSVRVWSAACSSGEEPFSLAMLLRRELDTRQPPWRIEIVATDLSTRVLEQAREGVWPAEKDREIPADLLRKYMLKGVRSQAGKIKAGPEIRSIVRFQRLNLADPTRPAGGDFDLIFCRNVLIYFNAEMKKRVIARLLDCLSPAGYLFLGQSETLTGINDCVRSAGSSAYRHVEVDSARGA